MAPDIFQAATIIFSEISYLRLHNWLAAWHGSCANGIPEARSPSRVADTMTLNISKGIGSIIE